MWSARMIWLRIAATLGLLLLLLAGCLAAGAANSPQVGSTVEPAASEPATSTVEPAGDRLVVLSPYGNNMRLWQIDPARPGSVQERPYGILSPDGSTLYVLDAARSKSLVRAYDMASGRQLRETALDGLYHLTEVPANRPSLSISGDGKRLLLLAAVSDAEVREYTASGKPRTRFAVLETGLNQSPFLIDLPGEFWFDALSHDGRWLYLLEIQNAYPPSYSPDRAPNYQVRAYDVENRRLLPDPVVDKRDLEQMSGYRQASVYSPDGDWLYSLYTRPSEGPFLHALNLASQAAFCIDLPFPASGDYEADMVWSLALAADGARLYAINGTTGQMAQVDVANDYAVRRSATLDLKSTAAGSARDLLTTIANWLLPAAHAKISRMPGAVLSPDGSTLYATGRTGLLVIDTRGLKLRGRYLSDQELNSLAIGAGGTILYTVAGTPPGRGRLLAVDPQSGVPREIAGVSQPWAVVRAGRP